MYLVRVKPPTSIPPPPPPYTHTHIHAPPNTPTLNFHRLSSHGWTAPSTRVRNGRVPLGQLVGSWWWTRFEKFYNLSLISRFCTAASRRCISPHFQNKITIFRAETRPILNRKFREFEIPVSYDLCACTCTSFHHTAQHKARASRRAKTLRSGASTGGQNAWAHGIRLRVGPEVPSHYCAALPF